MDSVRNRRKGNTAETVIRKTVNTQTTKYVRMQSSVANSLLLKILGNLSSLTMPRLNCCIVWPDLNDHLRLYLQSHPLPADVDSGLIEFVKNVTDGKFMMDHGEFLREKTENRDEEGWDMATVLPPAPSSDAFDIDMYEKSFRKNQ